MQKERPLRRRNSTQSSELSQLIQAFKNLDINQVIRTAELETTRSQRRRLTQLRQRNSSEREWIPVLARITRRQSQRHTHTESQTEEEAAEGEINQHPFPTLLSMRYPSPAVRSHLAPTYHQSSPVVFGMRLEVMIQENPPQSAEAVVVDEVKECPSEEDNEEFAM